MKQRCEMATLGATPIRCLGEEGHPGPCLYDLVPLEYRDPPARDWKSVDAMMTPFFPLDFSTHPDILAAMYDMTDPLDVPLPKIAANADWDAKDRQIEWVLRNFTTAMHAKLYKLLHDGRGIRRSMCDEIIKKG